MNQKSDLNTSRFAGMNVLIVEDDLLLAEVLIRMLEDNGAHVTGPLDTVSDALSAIRETEGLSMAILDVNLRGQRTDDVAEELRRRGVPFAFLTGNVSWLNPGIHDGIPVIQKPIEPDALLDLLAELRPV